MSATNWGMLSKSQEDPETIEEAIARLITAHNADEESHLDTGQSLQSHKASAIIDHLALSIVEDKIGDGEISLQKLLSVNRFVISCFESIDGWDVVKNRNKITERFLKEYKEEYLVFLDSDIVPEIKWIQMAVESKLDFINIPCPFYQQNEVIVTCLNTGTNKWYSMEEYKTLVKDGNYKFRETQIAGAGCLVVHRKVLKKFQEPWWEHPVETYPVGEDVLFCYKINKIGYRLFSLLGALCNHYKENVNLANLIKETKKKEIPKIIHQLWIGSKEIPYKEYRKSVKKFHPNWEYIMWDEKRLLKEKMISKELYNFIIENPMKPKKTDDKVIIEKMKRDPLLKISDIVRYNILKKYGGVYIDVDILCIKPLDDLIENNEMIVAFEGHKRIEGLVGNSAIGSIPNHPAMIGCINEINKIDKKELAEEQAFLVTGPFLLTKELTKYQDVTIFNHKIFYPILSSKDVKKRLKNINSSFFKHSYLVHPWGLDYEK